MHEEFMEITRSPVLEQGFMINWANDGDRTRDGGVTIHCLYHLTTSAIKSFSYVYFRQYLRKIQDLVDFIFWRDISLQKSRNRSNE